METARMLYHGIEISGGGQGWVNMTTAQYLANKEYLDSTDLLIELIDDDSVADSEGVSFTDGTLNTNLEYVSKMVTKNEKIEFTDTAVYPHTAGSFFYNKDGEYCKASTGISVGQTLTKNTNYTVTDKSSQFQTINSDLTDLNNPRGIDCDNCSTLIEIYNTVNKSSIYGFGGVGGSDNTNLRTLLGNVGSAYARAIITKTSYFMLRVEATDVLGTNAYIGYIFLNSGFNLIWSGWKNLQ